MVAGDMVHIRKQEELIKPKKILAKIDIESEWEVNPLAYNLTLSFPSPSLFFTPFLSLSPSTLLPGVSGILSAALK